MSRETILQTKDLSAGRHPAASAKESSRKSQNLDWKENFLEGINIHYYGWSILFNQEETQKVWLHLLGDPVHDFLGINMHLIFLSETAASAIMWTARALWEIDVNSEIELSSPFNSGDALCVLWLFISFPLLPFSSFLLFSCIYCFIRPNLLLHLLFWASLLFLSLSVVCQVVSLWKLSDL